MACFGSRVTVATTATKIASGGTGQGPYSTTKYLIVVPSGGVTVYLGSNVVDTSGGYGLSQGIPTYFELGQGDDLYGVVSTGTQVVHVLQIGK